MANALSCFLTKAPAYNQKVPQANPGAQGKLGAVLKSSVLVEVDGRFVTVSNKMLDRITVCQ